MKYIFDVGVTRGSAHVIYIDMFMIFYVYVIICELYDNTYGTMCSMICLCVCLRYDMIMIQDVNDGWIYI